MPGGGKTGMMKDVKGKMPFDNGKGHMNHGMEGGKGKMMPPMHKDKQMQMNKGMGKEKDMNKNMNMMQMKGGKPMMRAPPGMMPPPPGVIAHEHDEQRWAKRRHGLEEYHEQEHADGRS